MISTHRWYHTITCWRATLIPALSKKFQWTPPEVNLKLFFDKASGAQPLSPTSDVMAWLSSPAAQLSLQVPGLNFWPLVHPEPAPSQLSQQKNSKMGGAHFCWKYLVYPLFTFLRWLEDIYTISTGKKMLYTLSTPSAGNWFEIDATLVGYVYWWKVDQTMLLKIITWLLVAGDGNVRSNKCLG